MNAVKTLELVKQHGIFGLGDYDGCMCCNFEVCGVRVDVSCRKSSGSDMFKDFFGTTVRVHSRHMDAGPNGLMLVASEVVIQVQEHEGHLPINLRFCDYESDKEGKCVYCGEPRAAPTGYLCSECTTGERFGKKLADTYAYDKLAEALIADAAVPAKTD